MFAGLFVLVRIAIKLGRGAVRDYSNIVFRIVLLK